MWLKYATGVDTPILAKNNDLAIQKSNIIKLDIDTLVKVTSGWSNLKSKVSELNAHKLAPVPDDLSKLCQSVKKDIVKITKCNEFFKKFNGIKTTDTSDLVKKMTMTQKLEKLERKYLIMIMINILLLMKLIS